MSSYSGNDFLIFMFLFGVTGSSSKYHPHVEIGPQLAYEVEEHVLMNGRIMIFLGDPQFKSFPRRWFYKKSMKEAIGGKNAVMVEGTNLGNLSGFPKLTLVTERS